MVTNNVLHRDDSSSPIAGCEVRVLGETPALQKGQKYSLASFDSSKMSKLLNVITFIGLGGP